MYRSPYGDRNRKIAEFVETYDWSYQLVADKFGVTRNAVARIMFRRKHPYSERVRTPKVKPRSGPATSINPTTRPSTRSILRSGGRGMDIDIADTDTYSRDSARIASKKLLARLHYHHDARMYVPEGWVKPEPVEPEASEPTPEFKALWFGVPEDIGPVEKRYPRIADIVRAVAEHFHITVDDILSDRRHKDVILPRHIGMYLARHMTLRSHAYISARIGNRDHSVTVYAADKIKKLCQTNWMVAYDVAQIEASLS